MALKFAIINNYGDTIKCAQAVKLIESDIVFFFCFHICKYKKIYLFSRGIISIIKTIVQKIDLKKTKLVIIPSARTLLRIKSKITEFKVKKYIPHDPNIYWINLDAQNIIISQYNFSLIRCLTTLSDIKIFDDKINIIILMSHNSIKSQLVTINDYLRIKNECVVDCVVDLSACLTLPRYQMKLGVLWIELPIELPLSYHKLIHN